MATVHIKRTRSQTKLQRRSPTPEESKPILKKGSIAPYICALCHQGFTRRTTVKEPHFASCVKKRANPDGLVWDHHPSCYIIRSDGTTGPSGTRPAGLNSAKNPKKDRDTGSTFKAEDDSSQQTGKNEGVDRSPTESYAGGRSTDSNTRSSTSSFTPEPRTPEPQPKSSPSEREPLLPSGVKDPPQTKAPLSGMVMNQLANVVIAASKLKAGSGTTEASNVFQLWRSLLPQGFTSNVLAPIPDSGQKERQQAVVWMAQDVYKARSDKLQTIVDQLQLVRLWRDILVYLDDWEGVRKVERLLAGAWGESAGQILDEVQDRDRKPLLSSS